MLVSDSSDKVTNLVLGSQKSEAFAISNSPEFYEILSKSLYTNQKLAVIREVLCNASDSHIKNGVSTAINVTLKDGSLIVRDFGSGIPADDIHEVYCVYGNSTKKTDSNQTGGFGLGCKAPFAYSDNFIVTSWNQGKKNIYSMSKSTAGTEGLPTYSLLVSVPTDQTGLEVNIPIDENDVEAFTRYIHEVVYLGDLNVTLNGTTLERLPSTLHTDTKVTFVTKNLLNGNSISQLNKHKTFVRYGSVVYPLITNEAYSDMYDELIRSINEDINSSVLISRIQAVIFDAEPNTLAVAPSREALSLQDKTIVGIKRIISNYFATIKLAKDNLNNVISTLAADVDVDAVDDILSYNRFCSYLNRMIFDVEAWPSMLDRISLYMLTRTTYNQPKAIKDRYTYAQFIKKVLEKFPEPHDHKLFKLLDESVADPELPSNWFHETILNPVTNHLLPLFGTDGTNNNIRIFFPANFKHKGRYTNDGGKRAITVTELVEQDLIASMQMARCKILLVHSFKNHDHKKSGKMLEAAGQNFAHIAVRCGRAKADIIAMRKVFDSFNSFEVIDLLKSTDPVKRTPSTTANKPTVVRKAGWPSLSNIEGDPDHYAFYDKWATSRSCLHFTEKPLFYLYIRKHSPVTSGNLWTPHIAKMFTEEDKKDIALCMTDTQEKMLISAGVPSYKEYMRSALVVYSAYNRESYGLAMLLAKERTGRIHFNHNVEKLAQSEPAVEALGLSMKPTKVTKTLVDLIMLVLRPDETYHSEIYEKELRKLNDKLQAHPSSYWTSINGVIHSAISWRYSTENSIKALTTLQLMLNYEES